MAPGMHGPHGGHMNQQYPMSHGMPQQMHGQGGMHGPGSHMQQGQGRMGMPPHMQQR